MSTSTTHCSFISIIGLPNAGKSTLLNTILGTKISIVSHKPQTTRFRVAGIHIIENTQLIFFDTPGIFQAKKRFDKAMVKAAWDTLADADLTLFLIDASQKIGSKEDSILEELQKQNRPFFVILNKIDALPKPKLLEIAEKLSQKGIKEIFMISALKNQGIEDLIKAIVAKAPEGPWHYPEDQITDINERLWASEITRETLFHLLHQELPYGLTVATEDWEPFKDGSVKISQVIFVDRPSHRAIILGEKGTKIKEINMRTRTQLETFLGKKVHLFLHVKVDEKWQDRPAFYRDIGLEF